MNVKLAFASRSRRIIQANVDSFRLKLRHRGLDHVDGAKHSEDEPHENSARRSAIVRTDLSFSYTGRHARKPSGRDSSSCRKANWPLATSCRCRGPESSDSIRTAPRQRRIRGRTCCPLRPAKKIGKYSFRRLAFTSFPSLSNSVIWKPASPSRRAASHISSRRLSGTRGSHSTASMLCDGNGMARGFRGTPAGRSFRSLVKAERISSSMATSVSKEFFTAVTRSLAASQTPFQRFEGPTNAWRTGA